MALMTNRLTTVLVAVLLPVVAWAAMPVAEPDTVPLSEAPLMVAGSMQVRIDSLEAPSEEALMAAHMAANATIAGTWKFNGPSVDARGSSFVSRLGKPIAKSKLKKGLKKAYDKLKLKKRWTSFVLTREGRWSI
ncbi:MAG: DUF4923 family protein, partial [Muribaculaceae bacterium]|nr:DUF4923 family protein [Muribaculaceae bacterium]